MKWVFTVPDSGKVLNIITTFSGTLTQQPCAQISFFLSFYFVCLFVLCWEGSKPPGSDHTRAEVLCWEGSKPPGSDHTRAEAQTTRVPKTAAQTTYWSINDLHSTSSRAGSHHWTYASPIQDASSATERRPPMPCLTYWFWTGGEMSDLVIGTARQQKRPDSRIRRNCRHIIIVFLSKQAQQILWSKFGQAVGTVWIWCRPFDRMNMPTSIIALLFLVTLLIPSARLNVVSIHGSMLFICKMRHSLPLMTLTHNVLMMSSKLKTSLPPLMRSTQQVSSTYRSCTRHICMYVCMHVVVYDLYVLHHTLCSLLTYMYACMYTYMYIYTT